MKILFLHGWQSVPGGVKPSYLIQHGHEGINPALDDDGFARAVRTAQDQFNEHRSDVIIGSSLGGAVAINIDAGTTPLVLLCPAWRRWGTTTRVKPGTLILHSEADDVIPVADSQERAGRLWAAGGVPESGGDRPEAPTMERRRNPIRMAISFLKTNPMTVIVPPHRNSPR